MLDDIFAPRTAKRGLIETPGQTTVYHIGDAADMASKFIAKGPYYVLTAASDPAFPGGVFSGNANLDVDQYAANTISFDNATSKILDSANGLTTLRTGDTLIIKGSASNDGVVFTVTAGSVAAFTVINPAPTTEAAGAYISIYKRASHANAAVVDATTGLMWSRTTSSTEKVGNSSIGTLAWSPLALILHPAAADLSIIAPSTLRIINGAGEIARYHAGDLLVLAGFATAANNLPGWIVSSVVVNGAHLDITLRILGKTIPTAEAAGGARSISVGVRCAFNYAAAANAIALSGYTDWRLPTDTEIMSLRDMEQPTAQPDVTAFPTGWPTSSLLTSVTCPTNTANEMLASVQTGSGNNDVKTTAYVTALVRNV